MKYSILSILLALGLPAIAFSQNPSPSPTPVIEEDKGIVKITTNLIQLDVTVTDSKGRIVTDLKPGEIEVYENNQKQTITDFSFINIERKTLERQTFNKGKTPVPEPPVPLNPEKVRRTIALVVDDLSLSFQSASQVRKALKKFVDEQMQPDDAVAIIRTGSGVGAFQQFTSDKRLLYAAIERVKWNPIGTGSTNAFAPLEGDLAGQLGIEVSTAGRPNDDIDLKDHRNDFFAVGTLGTLGYIVRGMSELPGRKSIILFSEGFELVAEDKTHEVTTRDKAIENQVVNAIRQLATQATRASVVIYTLDARGLQTLNLTAADNAIGMTVPEIENAMDDRSAALADTQEGLSYLAQITGGIGIKNSNDLSLGVGKILDDQKGYYLIGYEPDEKTFDPVKARSNKLTVNVTRPGLKVRYRSSFFGVTDKKAKTSPKTPREQITNALYSPLATGDITLKLTPLFANDPKQGSFINSLIHIKASDLKFVDQPDGWKKASFDIVVIALGNNGTVVEQLGRTETLRVKDDLYDNIMKDGFVYSVPFPIKKPGAYQLRVALRDTETSKIGTANQFVETPDLLNIQLFLSDIIFQNVAEPDTNSEQDAAAEGFKSGTAAFYFVHSTALREFKSGSTLLYNLMILNPKIDKSTGQPKLKTQVKIFQNGKEIFTGPKKDYVPDEKADMKRLPFGGGVKLGANMLPGECILQVIVWDALAKEKSQIKTKWLDFEIIK